MKTSATKIIKSIFKLKDVDNIKKKINNKTIFVLASIFCLIIASSYLLKPFIFKYNLEKTLLEEKINDTFKIQSKINGEIKYNFIPTPRITFKDMELKFNNFNKTNVNFPRSTILLSFLNLKNIKDLKFKKFLVDDQKIKIYPKELKGYLKYIALKKEKSLVFKNSDFFFVNRQGDQVIFRDLNFNQKFDNEINKIFLNSFFSNNKIKIKFKDEKNKKKYFNASVPSLKTSLDVVFDQKSTLESQSGELRLDLFENIILVNFESSDDIKIYESFFRNKFLNSKFDGNISLKKNFYFDLNFFINKMNLRKLLFYYFDHEGENKPVISGLSKKINGKVKIMNKSSSSFLGKIKDFKATLIFENGDVRIQNASAKFPNGTEIDLKISLNDVKNDPFANFTLNFKSSESKKFFRKFELYNIDEKQMSIFANGVINLNERKIKFKNIIKNNNEKINKSDLMTIEKKFNENVIDKNILDVMDFFKLKKFAKEISYSDN